MAENEHPQHAAECRNVWQKWAGFLDKELSAEESARVQTHLDACGHCREFVETQTSFNRLLRKSLVAESQSLPENLRVKVLSLIERKSMGQLSEEDERANLASPAHEHAKSHSHTHGEPGHVHDHDHGHTHSHGMSPATRALFAVMLVGLVLVGFMALSERKKNEQLSDRIAGLESNSADFESIVAKREASEKESRDLADKWFQKWREVNGENIALQKKYDETVVNYDKLTRAMNALVNAGHAVMDGEATMKPVPELEKKWRDMFPKVGDMPHKAGDMDPSLWDVSTIEGEDVLWVVFSKKGDPKSKFTLMTFTEKYMREHYGELKGMAETVRDGKATITWQNTKDQKVYHALVSAGDLNTARAQLEALK